MIYITEDQFNKQKAKFLKKNNGNGMSDEEIFQKVLPELLKESKK